MQNLFDKIKGFNTDVTINKVLLLQNNVMTLINEDILKMTKKQNKSALKRYNNNMEYLKKYQIIINLFNTNQDCKHLEDILTKYNYKRNFIN